MIRIALTAAILLATMVGTRAQEPGPVKKKRAKPATASSLPASPPPTFMFVSKVDLEGKQLTMLYRQSVPVTFTKEVEVEKDGKRVIETRAYQTMRQEDRAQLLSFDGIVATVGGKAVESDEGWKALQGQIVMVTAAEKLDPAYARLLAKNTVVIETKPSKPQQ